jgi:DNA-binding transcriptional ArsR family regulator
MGTIALTPDVLELVAERFKALAEPARLRILASLRDGERTVGELVEITGLGQANVSKHLRTLHAVGFVARQREGLHVLYRLADEGVFTLCDLVCGRIQKEHQRRARVIREA